MSAWKTRLRLTGIIAVGFVLLLSLWGTIGPTRGIVPTPIPSHDGLPGVEAALQPIPEPFQSATRRIVSSMQTAAMRIYSPFGQKTSVRARLLDWQGNPQPEATLTAEAFGYRMSAKSDANGNVLIETYVIVGWVPVRLEARAADATGWYEIMDVNPGDSIDLGNLRLLPGGRLSGVVVDETDAPIPNAEVVLTRPIPPTEPIRSRPRGSLVQTWTDRAGWFHFPFTPKGPVEVWAYDSETKTWDHSNVIDNAPGHEAAEVQITIDRSTASAERRLDGFVVDQTGLPLKDARVCFEQSSRSQGTNTKEGGEFSFTFRGEPKALRAIAPGGWATVSRKAPFDEEPVRLVLEPCEIQRFEIRSLDGTPVSVVDLEIEEVDESHHFRLGDHFSHHKGLEVHRGGVEVPIPRRSFRVFVNAPGHAPRLTEELDPEALRVPFEIVLEPVPRFEGRVTRAGKAVAEAVVALHFSSSVGGGVVLGPPWTRGERTLEADGFATTDADGSFRLSPRPAVGFWPFRFRRTHLGDHGVLRAYFDGGVAEVGPLPFGTGSVWAELELTDPGSIAGQIIPPGGENPGGWAIEARRSTEYAPLQRTDSAGSFRFEHLLPGTWWLRATGKQQLGTDISETTWSGRSQAFDTAAYVPVIVRAGEVTDIEIPLAPAVGTLVRGRLEVDGSPMPYETVSIERRGQASPSWSQPSGVTDASGSFELLHHEADAVVLLWDRLVDGRWTEVKKELKPTGNELQGDLLLRTAQVEILETPTATDTVGSAPGWRYRGTTPTGEVVLANLREGLQPVPEGSGTLELWMNEQVARTLEIELTAGTRRRFGVADLMPVDEED